MNKPDEVFRRHIFEPTLKTLKRKGRGQESAKQKNGVGKDLGWEVRKM